MEDLEYGRGVGEEGDGGRGVGIAVLAILVPALGRRQQLVHQQSGTAGSRHGEAASAATRNRAAAVAAAEAAVGLLP